MTSAAEKDRINLVIYKIKYILLSSQLLNKVNGLTTLSSWIGKYLVGGANGSFTLEKVTGNLTAENVFKVKEIATLDDKSPYTYRLLSLYEEIV